MCKQQQRSPRVKFPEILLAAGGDAGARWAEDEAVRSRTGSGSGGEGTAEAERRRKAESARKRVLVD